MRSEASREKERLTVIARFKQFFDQKMSVNPRHQFVCKGWFWRKSKDRAPGTSAETAIDVGLTKESNFKQPGASRYEV